MDTTAEIFDNIKTNLITNLLYYTPEVIYYKGESTIMDLPELQKWVHKVTLRLADGQLKEIDFKKPELSEVFYKDTILAETIFIVSDAKGVLNSNQFKLLIRKYKEEVLLYINFTEIVIYNLNRDFKKELPELIINALTTQIRFLKDHYNEVEQLFDVGEVDEGKNNLTNSTIKVNQKDISKKPRKKKTPLMSENDAQKYLLEMVFHVKNK